MENFYRLRPDGLTNTTRMWTFFLRLSASSFLSLHFVLHKHVESRNADDDKSAFSSNYFHKASRIAWWMLHIRIAHTCLKCLHLPMKMFMFVRCAPQHTQNSGALNNFSPFFIHRTADEKRRKPGCEKSRSKLPKNKRRDLCCAYVHKNFFSVFLIFAITQNSLFLCRLFLSLFHLCHRKIRW